MGLTRSGMPSGSDPTSATLPEVTHKHGCCKGTLGFASTNYKMPYPCARSNCCNDSEAVAVIPVDEALGFQFVCMVSRLSAFCMRCFTFTARASLLYSLIFFLKCLQKSSVFFFFSLSFLPSTSLWGFYSETFIHRYSIPLTHAFTRLCVIFFPHMYIPHYNYYNLSLIHI